MISIGSIGKNKHETLIVTSIKYIHNIIKYIYMYVLQKYTRNIYFLVAFFLLNLLRFEKAISPILILLQ